MSRQLLMLRHAKSDWDNDALTDFERPLAKRGRKDAPRMGRWLREQGLIPNYVLSSPAERARQTTLKVCKELGIAEAAVHWEPRIYEASRDSLIEVLADCPPTANRVLLVGHNPGLEELLVYLYGGVPSIPPSTQAADGKLLPTAALAQWDMPENWSDLEQGAATLIALIWPRSLADG